MEFLTDTLFTEFGRTDYLGGLDNEALDFGQLDQFIHVTADTDTPTTNDSNIVNGNDTDHNGNRGRGQDTSGGAGGGGGGVGSNGGAGATAPLTIPNLTTTSTTPASQRSHLPESPPDSGSEPPYSPADLQGLTIVGPSTIAVTSTSGLQQRSAHHQHQHELSVVNLTSLSDFSQATLDLHHNHHLSLLTNHHSHHQQHDNKHHNVQQHQQEQQQQSSYMRNEQHSVGCPDQHNMHPMVSMDEMAICCKHDGNMLLQQSDGLIGHQQNGNNLLGSYRSDLSSHGSLLSIGSVPGPGHLSTDDLMPADVVYTNTTTSTPTPSNTIRSCQLTSSANLQMSSGVGGGRKRKLSHSDTSGVSLVKPEPGSLSPMCQHLDAGDMTIGSGLQNTPDMNCNGNNIGDANNHHLQSNPDTTGSGSGSSINGETCPLQCIRFSPFQQHNWHVLCNQSLQELPLPYYNVDADKGFNFSNSDDAFVCQKKNHFQITCHAKLHGNAVFVRTSSGLEKIKSFHLHFYGVKLEAPNSTIRIEQSQSDRSKKPFHPVPIDLQSDIVSKITVVRLHFSETTSNNMRKKGRPNPEQRYFQLVVGLHAHTHSGHFPIISHGSERIIVRASNPGQFESDVELCWQRGVTSDSIFHAGRVGINTDRPDECLVVHGNLKVSGHIVQPSDIRAKQEINEMDTSEQLRNLQKIRIVKYRYEPEFAIHSGLCGEHDQQEIIDTGVIAQEVREVIPDAVQEAGNIVLPNGQVIEKFLLVNKDRILMENIGAVKELCKVTGSLETRIEQLEKINSRLIRIQQLDHRKHNCSTAKCKHLLDDDETVVDEICSNQTIQKIIIILVIIMTMCLLAISALYFVEHRQHYINTSTSATVLTPEQIYNSNLKRFYTSGKQQPHQQQDTQQPDNVNKIPHDSNYPPPPGDMPANDIDFPVDLKYQLTQSLPSPKPKDLSMLVKTGQIMITLAPLLSPIVTDYDTTDHLSVAPAPPGDESSSEKLLGDSNLGTLGSSLNSFENNERSSKKIVKGGKSKLTISQASLSTSGNINTKKPQYQPQLTSTHQQHDQLIMQPLMSSTQTLSNTNNNKGHPSDATEDQDLQNLSNNNESDDQFSMENTVQINTFYAHHNRTNNNVGNILTIGKPSLCESVKSETIECQSVCCEESNRLLDSIDFAENNQNLNRSVDITEKDATITNPSTSSLCNSASSPLQLNNNNNNVDTGGGGVRSSPLIINEKQRKHLEIIDKLTQQQQQDINVAAEPNQPSSIRDDRDHQGNFADSSARTLRTDSSVVAQIDNFYVDHDTINTNVSNNINNNNNVSHEPNPSSDECFTILFFIRSETFNTSVGKETICLNGGDMGVSDNNNNNERNTRKIIYTIAVSKFMRETKIELHFVGPNSLHWNVCNPKGSSDTMTTVTNGNNGGGGVETVTTVNYPTKKTSQPAAMSTNVNIIVDEPPNIYQLRPSKSIFHLHLPNYGYFEKNFELHASFDFKSVCNTSNLLQYNIRIYRDCF